MMKMKIPFVKRDNTPKPKLVKTKRVVNASADEERIKRGQAYQTRVNKAGSKTSSRLSRVRKFNRRTYGK